MQKMFFRKIFPSTPRIHFKQHWKNCFAWSRRKKVSMYGSEKKNEISFRTINEFFLKLCLWTHRTLFFIPRLKTLRQNAKSFLLFVSKGKTVFFQKTISSKCSFWQLKSNCDGGFEKLRRKAGILSLNVRKRQKNKNFFKKFSSNCSHEHVDWFCDTLPNFSSEGKNHFFNVRKRLKRRFFFQTNFSIKSSFRTCRMPSWHPAEFFLPNAGKITAHCPNVMKFFFQKIYFSSECSRTRSMQLWRARQRNWLNFRKW